MQTHLAHVREIEATLDGSSPNRDPAVVASWKRCLSQHRLDPGRQAEAYIVPEAQLREHRQQSEDLIRIARTGIENLYNLVAGQNYVLLLADRLGVTVEYLGDQQQKDALRQSGLFMGAEWSEARAGTCALGACIEGQEALVIHQTDHFDMTHTGLSCTAAPIFDHRGQLAAVLDISLLSSPIQKTSQSLALKLVTATTRRIELANLMARARNEWVLRLAGSPDFLDVDPDAAVSLDGSGNVIGVTHGAARILCQVRGLDWRQSGGLIGRPISDFLDLHVEDLTELTRARPAQDRVISARDGHTLFAHVIEPQRQKMRGPGPQPLRGPLATLAGEDAIMATLLDRAARLAATDFPVLVTGETGTGKDVLARAIHAASGRKGPLVTLDCAGVCAETIEATLFGRSAGRGIAEPGLIAQAEGGTLLLAELAELPLGAQARLLRLVAEHSYVPVGAAQPVAVRLRILATSQHDLSERVTNGSFRKDLFYRLGSAVLHLPPLRHRADLGWLAERMARDLDVVALTAGARIALRAHSWPGNLRELRNTLSVAAALAAGGAIGPEHLPAPLADLAHAAPEIPQADSARRRLLATLEACGGNISQAARNLGLDRSTVHRQMRRYGISADQKSRTRH